jgi:hypothetical protein
MQIKQNSEQQFIEEETNRGKSALSEQLRKKATIAQRITAYLNSANTEV